jgi:hypothetical protein
MRFLGLAIMAGIWTAACGHHGNQAGAADAPSPTDALVCTAAQTLCGDTCADLMTDVSNCGACGHACGCGSTSCTAGICDAHVLAPSQGGPLVLALHDDQLYWGNDADRTVSTMPVTGGTASVLYPGRTQVRGIAFDPARIYFTRFVFNIVESGALDGTNSGNFTNIREPGAAGIATDSQAAYWATYDGGTTGLIRTAPLGARGTGTTLVANQVRPDGVAIDATSIYWTTNNPTGTVMKVAKTGGTAVTLADKQANPHSIVVAGGFVYWTNQGDGTPNTGSVQRISIDGDPLTVTTFADHQPLPFTVAVDASYVYWTDSVAAAVMRAPLAGGSPVPVVVHEAAPTGLVVSPACLYFADHADGNVGTGSIRSHDLD